MALSGVRNSWLMVARKRDFARFAPSARRRASSELSLACSSSAIERVLLRLKRDVARRGCVQALHDDEEIADHADRHGGRQRRVLQTGGPGEDDADDHRQHSGDKGGRDRRSQQRHNGRRQQHDEHGEGRRARLRRPQERDDEIGPGGAAEGGRENELAPPCARALVGVAVVEKRDRQRVDEADGAADEHRPRRERRGPIRLKTTAAIPSATRPSMGAALRLIWANRRIIPTE